MQFQTFFDEERIGMASDHATVLGNDGDEMRTEDMKTRPLTKADYDYIVREIDQWWGGPTSALAHPLFFYELGEHAKVVEADGIVVGFLFGFIAPTALIGYVHLVGIHPEYRRKHVGSMLYKGFEDSCRAAGCKTMKAITTLGNDGSVRFHEALGWAVEQIDDYAGPGRARIVFTKPLENQAVSGKRTSHTVERARAAGDDDD
jgi:GNAT superfamily N-acetyltransferase